MPSQSAKSETSRPTRSSSTTTRPPRARARGKAAASSSSLSQTKTPFPAASPSALTTHGVRGSASSAAVGTPAACRTSLAKDFEPSMRAAPALGPKTAVPAARSSSASPATSGASGPITTSSIRKAPGKAQQRLAVVCLNGVTGSQRGDAGISGRGVQLAEVRSLPAILHASACSRPPPPTMRTFTRRVYSGGRASDAGASTRRVRDTLPRLEAGSIRSLPVALEPGHGGQ